MIHGGLNLDLKLSTPRAQQCCLHQSLDTVDTTQNFWFNDNFRSLRKLNLENQWAPQCNNCRQLEKENLTSFRTGTNEGLGIYGQTDLSGPVRIDLMFDISCNLACRTCGPHSSTFWQKHLKEHDQWSNPVFSPRNKDQVIAALSNIDLSNLKMLVFCGGETLLGQEYWEVADWIADRVPDAKKNVTLCFQTNGTQDILPKNYKIVEKFFLVKLHVSLDGIEQQFEYLRWPASWDKVVENLQSLRENAQSNVMFLVEETISIFNLASTNLLDHWVKNNFSTNREGDVINHTKHLASGVFGLHALTNEYIESMNGRYSNLLPANFKENPQAIQQAMEEITKFDRLRNQNFETIFPEVAGYYSRFR